MKPSLEVSLSPALLHLYDIKNSIVVIIDVLRATSTISTALYNGATKVIPVATVPECVSIGKQLGAITAGERDGKTADGLEHGNSPFEYPRNFVEGKILVLTTTNGTRLLHMATDAIQIVTGAFANISIVCNYLVQQQQNVILACAAWKDRVNMEDTLFAGAVIDRIGQYFEINCDAALAAHILYKHARKDLFAFMKAASHFQRLSRKGKEEDIRYCLTPDVAPVLPLFKEGALVAEQESGRFLKYDALPKS